MAAEINLDALSYVRAVWPKAYVSGSGGPWAVLRFLYEGHPSVIFFPSKAEASVLAAKTGDRLIECRTPIPKIPKSRELGYE